MSEGKRSSVFWQVGEVLVNHPQIVGFHVLLY
jgi:hypothetical protein